MSDKIYESKNDYSINLIVKMKYQLNYQFDTEQDLKCEIKLEKNTSIVFLLVKEIDVILYYYNKTNCSLNKVKDDKIFNNSLNESKSRIKEIDKNDNLIGFGKKKSTNIKIVFCFLPIKKKCFG